MATKDRAQPKAPEPSWPYDRCKVAFGAARCYYPATVYPGVRGCQPDTGECTKHHGRSGPIVIQIIKESQLWYEKKKLALLEEPR